MIAEHLETVKKNIEESMAKRTGIFKDDPVQLARGY